MDLLKNHIKNKVENHFPTKTSFKDYHSILQKYWSGESDECTRLVTKRIEDGDGVELDVLYYRLWLEMLSETSEKASLHFLKQHFLKSAKNGFLKSSTLMALRGMIHMELEEFQSCEHLFLLLEKEASNPYALEFCQKYKNRFSADGEEESLILKSEAPVLDYLHWKHLCQTLLLKGDFSSLEKALQHVTKSFPNSPLEREFELYKKMDSESYSGAKDHAHSLAKDFPKKEEYKFLKSYLLTCEGKHKESSKILNDLLKKGDGKEDPDLYALLGHNSYLSSHGDIYSPQWDNAKKYFLKAEESLSRMGYDGREVLLSLALMARKEREESGKNPERENFRYWFVNLKASSFYRILTSDEKDLTHSFHPMGASPREGDLVFFVNHHPDMDAPRLGAVYQVLSAPIWSHHEDYQASLELVKRFERPVVLPESFSFSKGEHFQNSLKVLRRKLEKGCYLLSEKGLSALAEEVFSQIEDEKTKTIFKELKRKEA